MSETVLKEKLAKAVEEKGKTRTFRGFKAKLIFEADGVNVETDVRYAKMDSREIDEALKIVAKCRTSGKVVEYKSVGEYRKAWLTAEGEEIPRSDVEFYQEIGDELVSVEPFERTKTIIIEKLIALSKLDEFLIEKEYEVWGDNISALHKVAEWLSKNDKLAIAKFSFGRGFKEYYALIYPVIRDSEFVLVMALTRMNKIYRRLMPVKFGKVIAKETAKPTVKSVLKVSL